MIEIRELSHHFINANGSSLHVVEQGAGPFVLLVFGWPQTWRAWRKVIPRLAENFHVVAVDPPGIGDSGPSRSGYDTGAIRCTLTRSSLITARPNASLSVTTSGHGSAMPMRRGVPTL